MRLYFTDYENAKIRSVSVMPHYTVPMAIGRVRIKYGYRLYYTNRKDALEACQKYYKTRIETYKKKLRRLK